MGEKILVGPMTKGLRNDVTPFNIDNDSFPVLVNAYQWRGRVKRKRGTSPLVRLSRYFDSTSFAFNPGAGYDSQNLVGGVGNLLTGFPNTGIQADASVVPGSITIIDLTASNTYTDPAANGVLVGAPAGSGTINYASGSFTIAGGGTDTVTAKFNYYPTLPVMGLEDLFLDATGLVGLLAFDTTYSYNVATNSPFLVNDVTFFNNPASSTYPSYIQKGTFTPFTWNGQDYQQFWTVNYEGALWATNGINIPYVPGSSNVGMQFAPASSISVPVRVNNTTFSVHISGSPLVVGDFVFFNEWTSSTAANASTLNFQTGYVTNITGAVITITFPNATIAADTYTPGIIQYLTNVSNPDVDCIRWYNGAPTNPTLPVTFNYGAGWVNFMPPLSNLSFSIADLPSAQYYLVGAVLFLPFKDRLIVVGPVVQTSTGTPIYLQDTVIYSQNGTPYYTASFPVVAASGITPKTVYTPILVPTNQTATANSWWADQTGLGGWITAGFQSPINSASANEDVIIMGFSDRQARFAYTGNDILPFQFFVINSELGSGSTFSAINLDRGVMTMGSRGIVQTSQIECKRIDLDIPDQVFELDLLNQGAERVCAVRDFISEWVYFSYNINNTDQNDTPPVYPTQTLQYNYREGTWGVFNESYTTYGTFRQSNGDTWATIGSKFPTWSQWNSPWNSSQTTALQPVIVAGNTQGFVIVRSSGLGNSAEAPSLAIMSMTFTSLDGDITVTITSPNHCLNENDFIVIYGCLGTVGAVLNGVVFQISSVTNNTFVLDPQVAAGSYTYLGLGTITRMYVPFIASKAFPTSWGFSRKTRLGPQQYLMTTTPKGQVTLYIYLSQNYADIPGDNAYNFGPVIPSANSDNDSLIYSTVLYTCPESTNLGLTAANTNLQMIVNPTTGVTQQQQIWHRVNTSLIGDTVQIAITISPDQMFDPTLQNQFGEVELHAMILDVNPSSVLS